ncbi:glycosyltransferase [Nocardia sp. NPDC050406]|uniref:glycosyltransferase n=1 Tax=Nocardia sp. NPDC050406 TaxID=3364318 RepID=UPI0037ADBC76
MRILITVSDYNSHLYPMVPLARAVRDRGHDVVVACATGLVTSIQRAGLRSLVLFEGNSIVERARLFNVLQALESRTMPDHGLTDPETGAPLESPTDFDRGGYLRDRLPTLIAQQRGNFDRAMRFATEWKPDLVLSDPLSEEGLWVAANSGLPSVCHLWGPIGNRENETGVVFKPVDLTGYFATLGSPPADGIPSHDLVVDPTPTAVTTMNDARAVKVRYIPYNGGQADLPLPPCTVPTVCILWSRFVDIMFGSRSFLVDDLMAVVAKLPVRAFLLLPAEQVSRLRSVPANITVLADAPFDHVLRHSDCVVSTGAAGAVMTPASMGVPQLAIPFTAEHRMICDRVITGFGCGMVLPQAEFTRELFRDYLIRILGDAVFSSSAQQLSAEIAGQTTPDQFLDRHLSVLVERGNFASSRALRGDV